MERTDQFLASGRLTRVDHFTRADVDEWCAWPRHTDPLFQDYNPPDMKPVERDLWYSERRSRPDHEMFAITDTEGALVGRLFLRQIDRAARSAVLGIDLRSDRLEEGLGTDALSAFLEYYFGEYGFEVLRLDVAAYNHRARHVYEKLGWVHIGEHWNTYPAALMPSLDRDPRFAEARRYIRAGPGTISILHYDMELTRERWLDRRRP